MSDVELCNRLAEQLVEDILQGAVYSMKVGKAADNTYLVMEAVRACWEFCVLTDKYSHNRDILSNAGIALRDVAQHKKIEH